MNWPARGSLVWRLYALGLAQLALLAAAVILVASLLRSVLHAGPVEHPGPPRGLPWAPLSIFFASGLLSIGLGAVVGWRWMAQPIARLSKVARSLRAGDLKARAGLSRPDEIGDLGRGFDGLAERIEGLVLMQSELLANVSHELRTPLARIRVALDIASEGDAAAARRSLEEIAVDLRELEAMIDDILTTTRMDLQNGSHRATGAALRCRDVAPGNIAERACERFRERHPERGLCLSVADALPRICVDATSFGRVIDNLLDNAHEYSPADAPIRLGVAVGLGAVVFEVSDRGMGISPSDLGRVFEPFFRAERSRSRGTGGVGLGLTLAKRIVEAHGGQLELESSSGRGTRARVSVAPRRG